MGVQDLDPVARRRSGSSHGWNYVDRERKRELIEAIVSGKPTRGPAHVELNITDRCNVACYFCSQMDLRTKEQICYDRVIEIIDELIPNGLKSVRFAGGGDPLFHPDIARIFDYLGSRKVVVDNITTNGVGLVPKVADILVRDGCREVIFSLNAADAADYKRMMLVKPDRFDKVVENVRYLVKARGERSHPKVELQFLIDNENFHRMSDMYALGRTLGVDVVAIGLVLNIPNERIDPKILIQEAEPLRPYIRDVLEADGGLGILQLQFASPVLMQLVYEIRAELGLASEEPTAIAPSFKEDNAGCFFAWHTSVIRGNGDLHPCCLMQLPGLPTVGNARTGTFAEQWTGSKYTKIREEMREVLLTRGQIPFNRARFKYLEPQCVQANACYLKNIYFRADEEFYRELGEALDVVRKREVRWFGTPRQMLRRFEMFVYNNPRALRAYERLHNGSRPFRHWVRRRINALRTAAT